MHMRIQINTKSKSLPEGHRLPKPTSVDIRFRVCELSCSQNDWSHYYASLSGCMHENTAQKVEQQLHTFWYFPAAVSRSETAVSTQFYFSEQ